MKKKKKQMVFVILGILVFMGCITRIYWLNTHCIEIPKTTFYPSGRYVSMEENFFWDSTENRDGYEIMVNSAQIVTYKEFLSRYKNSFKKNSECFLPEYIVDVEVSIKNTNKKGENDIAGIELYKFTLAGKDILLKMSTELYNIANPDLDGITSFALRPQSEMVLHLPYIITSDDRIEFNELRDKGLALEISYYPEKKVIKLFETR